MEFSGSEGLPASQERKCLPRWNMKAQHPGPFVDSTLFSLSGSFEGGKLNQLPRLELEPQQKYIFLAWLVENKGNPKKAKRQKGELILGKLPSNQALCSLVSLKLPRSFRHFDAAVFERTHSGATFACWFSAKNEELSPMASFQRRESPGSFPGPTEHQQA